MCRSWRHEAHGALHRRRSNNSSEATSGGSGTRFAKDSVVFSSSSIRPAERSGLSEADPKHFTNRSSHARPQGLARWGRRHRHHRHQEHVAVERRGHQLRGERGERGDLRERVEVESVERQSPRAPPTEDSKGPSRPLSICMGVLAVNRTLRLTARLTVVCHRRSEHRWIRSGVGCYPR